MAEPDGHNRRRVLQSAAWLGAATILVKLVALAKDWLVARQLGAGDELDAFLVAFLLPSYAVVVLAHTFASGFVPTYVRVWQERGLPAAKALFGSVLLIGGAILVGMTILLAVVSPGLLPLVARSFPPEKLALTQSLFLLLLGVLLASGFSAMFSAVLNAHERFRAAALAPLAVPLVTFGVLLITGGDRGAYGLAIGTLLGFATEALVLAATAGFARLIPWPERPVLTSDLQHVGTQYLPVALAGLLVSSSLVVDQVMAASLGSGQVSVLSYGGKVVAVVLGAVAASLSTVLFPQFSRMQATGRQSELPRTLIWYGSVIFATCLPGILLLAVISKPLVRLLFERGEFTPEATEAVTQVQLWLLPQIPFYVVALLGARVLSALGANRLVLYIGALSLLLNVTGDYVLMHYLGVNGIAAATTLVQVVAAGVTLAAVYLRVGKNGGVGEYIS